MPRIARAVAVDLPHHITQRGNNQQHVFLDEQDREMYISLLNEFTSKYGTSIITDCLMPNHVHVIAIPSKEDSLARTFKDTHMLYARYFNKKMNRTGHLWQSRFYSCVLDELHLIAAARYIEQNPVRANLVEKPWQWKWSSASAHTNGRGSLIKLDSLFNYIDIPQNSWKEFIELSENKETVDTIRKHTLTGRPLGNSSFVKKLEQDLGRKFRHLKRGRPITE